MESHPERETEEKRVYARRRLRELIEQKLKRYGQPSLGGFGGIDVGIRFEDGTMAHLLRIGDTNIVQLNVYQTKDPMGPMTQYKSERKGEFTRIDINPLDSGALPKEEVDVLGDEEKMAALFVGSLLGGARIVQNVEEGVDGFPITAQEARDLTERLKGARIECL